MISGRHTRLEINGILSEFFVETEVCCYDLECVLYLITLGLFEFARCSGYCVPEIGHLGMVRGVLGLPDGVP